MGVLERILLMLGLLGNAEIWYIKQMARHHRFNFALLCGALLFQPWISCASVVWQYEGAGMSAEVWSAAREGASLTALHGASNGWVSAEVAAAGKHRVMAFSSGTTAFAFPTDATNRVAVAYAVTRAEEAEAMMTLFDAPYNVCVRLEPMHAQSWRWQREQLGYRASYRVNGFATDCFVPSTAFQLIEVRFETPPMLRDVYVGNAAATPMWLRHWNGEMGELMFFTREPTASEQDALYHYFRLKWGIPLPHERVNTAGVLDALGVRRGPLFSTILMVR